MEAQQIIALAEAHADKAQMRSSAELCIADAKSCLERGLVQYAKAYSVGIFSPVYKQAKGE
jgi:hypothetical protein